MWLLCTAVAAPWALEQRKEIPPRVAHVRSIAWSGDTLYASWQVGSQEQGVLRIAGEEQRYLFPKGVKPGGLFPIVLPELASAEGTVFAWLPGMFNLYLDDGTWHPLDLPDPVFGVGSTLEPGFGEHGGSAVLIWGGQLSHWTKNTATPFVGLGTLKATKTHTLWHLDWPMFGAPKGWVRAPLGTGANADQLDASDGAGIWLAGNDGGVWHSSDGTSWRAWDLDRFRPIESVRARSPDDAWVGFGGGQFAHWDGSAWSYEQVPVDTALLVDQGPLLGSGGRALGLDVQQLYAHQVVSVAQHGARLAVGGDGLWTVDDGNLVEHQPPRPDRGFPKAYGPEMPAGVLRIHGYPVMSSLHEHQGSVYFTSDCYREKHCLFQWSGDAVEPVLEGVRSPLWYGSQVVFSLGGSLWSYDVAKADPPESLGEIGRDVLGNAHGRSADALFLRNYSGTVRLENGQTETWSHEGWSGIASAGDLIWLREGNDFMALPFGASTPTVELKGKRVEHRRGDWMVVNTSTHREVVDLRTGEVTEHPCLPEVRASVTASGEVLSSYIDEQGKSWLVRSTGDEATRAPLAQRAHACRSTAADERITAAIPYLCHTELTVVGEHILASARSEPAVFELEPGPPQPWCHTPPE